MESIITQLMGNFVLGAILLYQLNIVYSDWKTDRVSAASERATLESKLDEVCASLNELEKTIREVNGIKRAA